MNRRRTYGDDATRADGTGMKGWILLLCGLAVSGVSVLLSRFPGVVEGFYGQRIGPVLARWLSLATGWIPVSVSAVLVLLLAGWTVWRSVVGVRAIRAGDLSLAAALGGGASWVAGVVGVVLLAFYTFWGLNYARAPVDQRLGLELSESPDVPALIALSRYTVDRANRAYQLLHDGEDDAGEPTARPESLEQFSSAMEVGWRRTAEALDLSETTTRSYGPVKTVGATRWLTFIEVSGVYSPFTGEAHVNGGLPGATFGATAAHEHAHQRGVAQENEATFVGILTAIHSDDPYARYVGWYRAAFTLLSDLARADSESWERIGGTLAPGIRRDRIAYVEWFRENRGAGGAVATQVNDRYLKAHGVPGGVQNYGRVTELLLAWADRYDGRLTVLPGVGEGA